jgi:hypothetical protein
VGTKRSFIERTSERAYSKLNIYNLFYPLILYKGVNYISPLKQNLKFKHER